MRYKRPIIVVMLSGAKHLLLFYVFCNKQILRCAQNDSIPFCYTATLKMVESLGFGICFLFGI